MAQWGGAGSQGRIDRVGAVVPVKVNEGVVAIEPLFVNLARSDAQELRSQAGIIGWVLWLAQQRRRRGSAFQDVLQAAVQQVDRLPEQQRERGRQLLWFAHALVYHERQPGDREQCAELIRASVRASWQVEV